MVGTAAAPANKAAAWREPGCALVDIVDCMLAAVEASMSILWASDSASE
jgi:hypothetical protein